METKDLLILAKKIIDANNCVSLTGTLMLKHRGIDLGREPHDIDLLICDYAPTIKFPDDIQIIEKGHGSTGMSALFEYKGILIDVMSDGERPEIVDGVLCGTMQGLMNAKYQFSKQNNSSAQKHHDDLVKLGFIFPEEIKSDLPF